MRDLAWFAGIVTAFLVAVPYYGVLAIVDWMRHRLGGHQ